MLPPGMTKEELGQRFLEPGLFLKSPIDQISLGMALVFGTAGMPHILMRFFTVPTAQAARTSVIWAMGIIGGFYVLTLFLGTGAAMLVGSAKIASVDAGGNMAGPLLAQYLGGGENSLMGNFMLAFVAAVAFATIVAVVAGLVLAAASAMAHDIYVGVIRGDHATPKEQVVAARVASVIVGIIAITVGILAKGQNVAHLVALAFAVAASSNLPAVFLTLYWKKCNTTGIIAGMIVGATDGYRTGDDLSQHDLSEGSDRRCEQGVEWRTGCTGQGSTTCYCPLQFLLRTVCDGWLRSCKTCTSQRLRKNQPNRGCREVGGVECKSSDAGSLHCHTGS